MATYGPGTFLKKAQNPENRIPENRWVLGMFYLTTKLHIGIYWCHENFQPTLPNLMSANVHKSFFFWKQPSVTVLLYLHEVSIFCQCWQCYKTWFLKFSSKCCTEKLMRHWPDTSWQSSLSKVSLNLVMPVLVWLIFWMLALANWVIFLDLFSSLSILQIHPPWEAIRTLVLSASELQASRNSFWKMFCWNSFLVLN